MKIKNLSIVITLILSVVITILPSDKTFAYQNNSCLNNENEKTVILNEQKNKEANIDTANWMRDYAQDDTPLGLLSIPGTHDSAAFNTWVWHSATRPWAVTQEKDIIQQLHMGIRYLDFRSSQDFYMYHGGVNVGHDLLTHFREVTDFLKSHQNEFVVIRLKNEKGDKNKFASRLDNEIFSNPNSDIRQYLAVNPSLNEKVENLRGKILLINDIGTNINFPTVAFNKIEKQDNWNPSSYEKKLTDIISFNARVQNEKNLTINHVSFTFTPKTIWNISKEMNNRVYQYLEKNHFNSKNTGVLVFDYPSKELIKEILERNLLSRQQYLTTHEINVVAKEDSIDKFILLSAIDKLPNDKVAYVTFENIPSCEIEKNMKVVGHVTFIDGSTSKVIIPVNILPPNVSEETSEAIINVYNYNSSKHLSKGDIKTSFKSGTLTLNLSNEEKMALENKNDNYKQVENKILKEFFYKYYDLSKLVNSEKEDVNSLIDYAIIEFIEPKQENKFYLSELQSIKYIDNKIIAESYYEDGTHIISEIPIVI